MPSNENAAPDHAAKDMEAVAFEQMRLQVGEVLRLASQNPDAPPAHYSVQYIGALPGKGLITSLPVVDGKGLWMPPGSTYVVRVLSGTYVYAFTSQVIRARANPYPHVHFQYPSSVQARRVRNSLRVSMNLQVEVADSGGAITPAHLLDLGMHGARIETAIPLAEEEPLQLTLPIQLEEARSQLRLQARVRNRTGLVAPGNGQAWRVGLEFDPLAEKTALLLHYFIDHAFAEEGAGKR